MIVDLCLQRGESKWGLKSAALPITPTPPMLPRFIKKTIKTQKHRHPTKNQSKYRRIKAALSMKTKPKSMNLSVKINFLLSIITARRTQSRMRKKTKRTGGIKGTWLSKLKARRKMLQEEDWANVRKLFLEIKLRTNQNLKVNNRRIFIPSPQL